jgi:hypothetical protein
MEMERLTSSRFCILDTQQSLPETLQSIIRSVSISMRMCAYSQGAQFRSTSQVAIAVPIGSHTWNLFTGTWRSADGVTVDLYSVSPALWEQAGSQIGRIGVIAHNIGRYLGAPAVYDSNAGNCFSPFIHDCPCFKVY